MFMIMFGLGLIFFVTGAFRLIVCYFGEIIKGDRYTNYRKRAWRNVLLHYGVTFLFFYLSFHL